MCVWEIINLNFNGNEVPFIGRTIAIETSGVQRLKWQFTTI